VPSYIARRLLFLPFLWLAVTMLVFALLEPLGPYQRLALFVESDPETLSGRVGGEALERIIERYGLNDPFHVQYGRWLGQVFEGNLGWSRTARAPVTDALLERLPATVELTLFAVVPVIVVAVWLGVLSAVHRDRWPDHVTRAVTLTGYSMPTFAFAILALMVFYGELDWFPPGQLSLWAEQVVFGAGFQRYTGLVTVDALLNGRTDIFLDALRHLVLPVVTLAYLGWAGLTQVTRSSMLEALGQDYVVAARAKGLPERLVVYKHARRNAMIPVTTISVGVVIGLLSGVIITETVFNRKGIGFWAVTASQNFDVPAVLGVTLFSTTLIVLGNLVADVLYTIVDPRIRYG
jgi:peptide/nickel transport system permease protein